MLSTIAKYLRGGERVNFTLMRDGADGVRLLITPVLTPEDEKSDDRAKQIRAMLARPVLIKSTVDTLETSGLQALQEAADIRTEIAATYEGLLADLRGNAKTAAKLAEPKADAGKGSRAVAKVKAQDSKPAESAPATDSGNDAAEAFVAAATPGAAAEPMPHRPSVDLFGGE